MTASLAVLNAVNSCPTITKEQGGGIFGALAKPIAAVLAAFYHVVPSYGVAILGLSLVWMLIISPLTLKSTRSMLAMQKLQPQLKKLQEQHRNDRQAFAQAQMELFREQGVSPFGSCLPTILPLPVFFALFRVIDGLSHKVTVGHGASAIKCPNPHYLAPHTQMFKDIVAGNGSLHSFGMDLAKNALSSHSSFAAALPFWALLLIMIGTQYLQTVQMMSRNPAAQDNPQMKMMKYIPIVFGLICIRFPAGVVLYYSMSNVCRIAQQTAMYRFDPKVRALAAKDIIEVEAHTAEIDDRNRKGKGGGGGGTSLAKKPADAPKPKPKSRFQAMLEQANEREAERKAAKAATKGPQDAPAKSGSSGNGSNSGKANASSNRGSAKGGGKSAPANRSGNGGNQKSGTATKGTKAGNGAKSGNGNGNGNGAKNGNAGNGANGRSRSSEPPPIKTNRARTGARSGGGKKRRGR